MKPLIDYLSNSDYIIGGNDVLVILMLWEWRIVICPQIYSQFAAANDKTSYIRLLPDCKT